MIIEISIMIMTNVATWQERLWTVPTYKVYLACYMEHKTIITQGGQVRSHHRHQTLEILSRML